MSRPRVLVVEGHPGNRKMLRVTLESHGCDVVEARDGAAALAALDDLPDLVVQDLVLPDMDGIALRDAIRARAENTRTPVVAVCAHAQELFGEAASAAGFDERIRKPVEPSALLSAVQRLLPGFASGGAGDGTKVLVADDTDLQRKLTVLRLRDAGYEVVEAPDGTAALAAVRGERPDVVVADVLMPGLDGFELCRRIAQDPQLTHVPVILASSVFVEESDRELAVKAGAVGFVTREPDMAAILEAIRRVVTARPARTEDEEGYAALHAARLGRALAAQAAEHGALEEELAQRDAQLAVIAGISDVLGRSPDPAAVIEDILVRCVEATGVAGAEFRSATPGEVVRVGEPPDVPADAVEAAARDGRAVVSGDGVAVGLRDDREELGVVVLGGDGRPFTPEQVDLCRAVAHQLSQAVALARRQAEIIGTRDETIARLASAVTLRDGGTGEHVRRMSEYCVVLGRALGLSSERCELLRTASAMHDLGKVATPDSILLKEGPLTAEERAEIQRHTEIGHAILSGSGSELLELAATIALSHHERWDGTGYPRGLRGEEIGLEARIAAVADVLDALLSDRPYRPAMPVPDALGIIRSGRGTHFDPAVLDAFERTLPDLLALG